MLIMDFILDHIVLCTTFFSIVISMLIKGLLKELDLDPQCNALQKLLTSKQYSYTQEKTNQQKWYLRIRYFLNFKYDLVVSSLVLMINAFANLNFVIFLLLMFIALPIMLIISKATEKDQSKQGVALIGTLATDAISIAMLIYAANVLEGLNNAS